MPLVTKTVTDLGREKRNKERKGERVQEREKRGKGE